MQQILAYVESQPESVTAHDVAQALDGIDEAKARKYLGRAAARGHITRQERGRFASLSLGSSVPTVPSAGHIGHITHKSSIDTCPICQLPLHPALVASGSVSHPNCDNEGIAA